MLNIFSVALFSLLRRIIRSMYIEPFEKFGEIC